MSQERHPLAYVDAMIDYLEKKIQSKAVNQPLLDALQKRLDAMSAKYASDQKFVQYYPHMLELQALIYGEGGQEQKALTFLKEAVRETGSVSRLYSGLLRHYVITHSRQAIPATPLNAAVGIPSASHRRAVSMGTLKIAFAGAAVLVCLVAATLHFMPRAFALPSLILKHSEIVHDKQQYDSLSSQYQKCSSDLQRRKDSIDQNDPVAVDAYTKDIAQCSTVLKQLNQSAQVYNNLVSGAASR